MCVDVCVCECVSVHMHVLHVSRYPERPEENIRSARAGWIMEVVSYPTQWMLGTKVQLCGNARALFTTGPPHSSSSIAAVFPSHTFPYLQGCQCVRNISLIKVSSYEPGCVQPPRGHLL